MIEPTIYISTCDKTKSVLKPAIMLMEKYWPKAKKVVILGYNGEGIELPKNYSFVSMNKAQESIESWAMDIASIIEKDTSKYVVFLLDDMLQLDRFDQTIFNLLLAKMKKDETIIRADLGMDLQSMPCQEIAKFGDCVLVEKNKIIPRRYMTRIDSNRKGDYWHTTQPSIWRKDYFVSVLKRSKDPWHFETVHPIPILKREIGTRNKYAAPSMIETAISNLHPGMFNIMGLPYTDIKSLIDLNIVSPEVMQWGMRKGSVQLFNKHGFSFTMSKLKGEKDAHGVDLYNHYKNRYGDKY